MWQKYSKKKWVCHNHYEANGALFEFNFEVKINTDMGSQLATPPDAYCMRNIK